MMSAVTHAIKPWIGSTDDNSCSSDHPCNTTTPKTSARPQQDLNNISTNPQQDPKTSAKPQQAFRKTPTRPQKDPYKTSKGPQKDLKKTSRKPKQDLKKASKRPQHPLQDPNKTTTRPQHERHIHRCLLLFGLVRATLLRGDASPEGSACQCSDARQEASARGSAGKARPTIPAVWVDKGERSLIYSVTHPLSRKALSQVASSWKFM